MNRRNTSLKFPYSTKIRVEDKCVSDLMYCVVNRRWFSLNILDLCSIHVSAFDSIYHENLYSNLYSRIACGRQTKFLYALLRTLGNKYTYGGGGAKTDLLLLLLLLFRRHGRLVYCKKKKNIRNTSGEKE